MLAIPSKTDFFKVLTFYDILSFLKLYSKSCGMDPSAPIIIGNINVSFSHIVAISNCSSELSIFSFLFRISLLSTGHATSVVKHSYYFPEPQVYNHKHIHFNTDTP